MKYTNEKNLPQSIVDCITNTDYKPTYQSYGVTTLLKDNLEIVLLRRYWEELEQDVADSIFAMTGTAIHEYIKKHDKTKYSEFRMEYQVSNSKILGYCDLYDSENELMVDYKTTTVWKVLHKEYEEWRKQLLLYCWLLEKCENLKCRKAKIIAILRDWSLSEKLRSGQDYPQKQVETIEFDFSEEDMQWAETFVNTRVIELEKMKYTSDEYIPECSDEAKWMSSTRYAVYKIGNKTAKRVVDTYKQAEEYIDWFIKENPKVSKNELEIVERKGEPKKCQAYCQVANHCPFYQKRNESEQV